jgi:hypothetical protein
MPPAASMCLRADSEANARPPVASTALEHVTKHRVAALQVSWLSEHVPNSRQHQVVPQGFHEDDDVLHD